MPRSWRILSVVLILVIISGLFWLIEPAFTIENLLRFVLVLGGLILIGGIIYFRLQSPARQVRKIAPPRFQVISRGSEVARGPLRLSGSEASDLAKPLQTCLRQAAQKSGAFCIPRPAESDRPDSRPRLFGTAGIRGVTNIQITPLLALKMAEVYGDYLGNSGQLEPRLWRGKLCDLRPKEVPSGTAHYSWQYPAKAGLPHYKGTVAVGYDTRYGVQMLNRATTSGLMSAGINVIDCGCIPTGGLSCFVVRNQLAGGVMITGSHTPYEMIGLIIIQADGAYLSNEMARELERRYYAYDKRQVTVKPEDIGQYRIAEHPLEIYHDFLLGLVNQDMVQSRHYKVLIDPCNGTAGLVLPDLLKSLGCEVVLNNESLCPVPNRPAEPRANNLGPTALKVREHNCDLGIATDIDADRVLFIDEKGNVLSEDLTGAIFARSVLEASTGKKTCVTPLNSSGLIDKVCTELGQELVYCPIGAPETLRVIKEIRASFAYEESGKYYFAEDVHWADGILASIKLLEIMARENRSLGDLAAEFPRFYQVKHTVRLSDLSAKQAGEIGQAGCSDPMKDKIMERVRGLWEKDLLEGRLKDMTLDGLKRSYQDGSWLLIRRSGTEPLIRVFADAPSAGRAEELVSQGEALVQRVCQGKT